MNIYSKIDLHILRSIALASILCFFCSLTSSAQQISGVVTDSQTGDTLLYPSASYKGNHVAVSGDAQGRYRIERHNGWYLTFSAVGYQSKRILINEKTPSRLDVKLKPDSKQLNEVVIKEKRGKYSRKDNPAVELMRRVIAAKKRTDLHNHDYLQYNKYQKITLGVNDIGPTNWSIAASSASGNGCSTKWSYAPTTRSSSCRFRSMKPSRSTSTDATRAARKTSSEA